VASDISKTQIDRLGDRLKKGNITEADLRLLDQYRLSFGEAYEFVVRAIRTELALEPTGRPAKSTTSVSEKLTRESIRLTQVQDIAGCRLVVSEIAEEQRVVESLAKLFENAVVVDRREKPSHGYRAVHVIAKIGNKPVEIQVRTLLQHVWAELSEKLSDVIDPGIKYGRGDQAVVDLLLELSSHITEEESQEVILASLQRGISVKLTQESLVKETKEELGNLQREISEAQKNQVLFREATLENLGRIIERVPTSKRK